MKNPSLLRWVAIAPLSAAIAWSYSPTARADDLALSFELAPRPPQPTVQAQSAPDLAQAAVHHSVWIAASAQVEPLEIPAVASSVPIGASDDATASVPPPPPEPAAIASTAVSLTPQVEAIPAEQPAKPAELSFDVPPVEAAVSQVTSPATATATASSATSPNRTHDTEARLFEGGPDSLVARAVGSAEGTRTPDGQRNPAYYGHVDPGNGVWNLGSFSYQHGASSPEEADVKQLARLRQQAQVLEQKAIARNLQLTLEERLNGIDLANQSPRAALSRGGYIDWLDQAHQKGMRGSDAVLWARTRSFLDPDTSQWDAPGLGNNLYRISSDQERRLLAIAKAIEADRRRPNPAQPPESAETEVADQAPLEQASLEQAPPDAEEKAIARLFEQQVPPAFEPANPELTSTTAEADRSAPTAASESAVDSIVNLDLPEEGNVN